MPTSHPDIQFQPAPSRLAVGRAGKACPEPPALSLPCEVPDRTPCRGQAARAPPSGVEREAQPKGRRVAGFEQSYDALSEA